MWKHVVCPYILKFNGVLYHNDMPAIVTPWMPHGNITEYLEKHPDADRLRLVSPNLPPQGQALADFTPRHYQLLDVVKGVGYLHNHNITHGDIKGVSSPTLTKFQS